MPRCRSHRRATAPYLGGAVREASVYIRRVGGSKNIEPDSVPTEQYITSSEGEILGRPLSLFGAANLHIVTEVTAKSWRLLFASIELLPLEIPAPVQEQPIVGPVVNRGQTRVFGHHLPTSVRDALTWYSEARSGNGISRPERDGRLLPVDRAEAAVPANAWLQEPDWPNWVTASSDFPILSGWQAGATRVHHLIACDFEWAYMPEDATLLDDFLQHEVGFTRSEWPQLAGSVHLLVPNPYIRGFREELDTSTSPEGINVAVVPRQGVQTPPMQIEILEHRPTGIGCSRIVTASSTDQRVPMYGEIAQPSTTIRNARTGEVEFHSPAAPFFRQMGLTMDVSSHTRKIQVRDLDGNALEEVVVRVAQPGVNSVTGESAGEALKLLEKMSADRNIRASAQELEQLWVSGAPEAARVYVRERINGAREQVMIIDPYLGWVDIQRYAFATRLANVSVRLLTSKLSFKESEAQTGNTPVALDRELSAALGRDQTLGEVHVRVMNVSELHDRFLRVDSRLYALGNSLSALGQRAGLMMRIPDPTQVFAQLEAIWGRAQPLSQYTQVWLKSRAEDEK